MRNDALIRVLTMGERLRGGRCRIDDLAREFNVTTRTIRRDLEVLSVVGLRVRNVAGFWWIDERTKSSPPPATSSPSQGVSANE